MCSLNSNSYRGEALRNCVRMVDWNMGEPWRALHVLAKNPEFEPVSNGESLKALKIIQKN